jgi:dihydroorotate dehydrogenase
MVRKLFPSKHKKNSFGAHACLRETRELILDNKQEKEKMNRIFAEQGYKFDGVPFGPAAGAISGNSQEEMEMHVLDVARSPAEGVKFGSLTWNGGLGNTVDFDPIYYHNPNTGQTVNSIGLANIGVENGVRFQQRMQPQVENYGKPLVPSISPGKGEKPMVVLPEMASRLVKVGAKIIEVNLSCPNKVVDGEQREPILGYDRNTVEELDDRIREEIGHEVTIIYKEPPFVGEHSLLIPDVSAFYARALMKGNVAANLSNTIGGQRIPNELGDPALGVPGNLGGMSGPYTVEAGIKQLRSIKPTLPEEVGVISSLGVDSGYEVQFRTKVLRADFTEGVTVFWENKKRKISFGETVLRVAQQYAEYL